MEFHKDMGFSNNALSKMDILSRNTLLEVSEDLQLLNNIQRVPSTRNNITNLQNEVRTKFSTDSYPKAICSDVNIKKHLSGVIYTDNNYQLALNIINLTTQTDYTIISTIQGSGSNLSLTTIRPQDLKIGDFVYLSFNGGTGSSQEINPKYFGYHTVTDVSNNYVLTVSIGYGNIVGSNDYGTMSFIKKILFKLSTY
jgi:hypothetical protein